MKNNLIFSDEQLNAFIDDQLDIKERTEVLDEINTNPLLDEEIQELRQIKELVVLAYADLPQPSNQPNSSLNVSRKKTWLATAAAFVLSIGLAASLFLPGAGDQQALSQFVSIGEVDIQSLPTNRILLHIGTRDPERVQIALQAAERWLASGREHHRTIKVEIVAAADGLNIVRKGTPYQPRIRALIKADQNITVRACGFAMEHRRMKEGRVFELIPEAKQVNAALEQILKRLKQGWLYVRA